MLATTAYTDTISGLSNGKIKKRKDIYTKIQRGSAVPKPLFQFRRFHIVPVHGYVGCRLKHGRV